MADSREIKTTSVAGWREDRIDVQLPQQMNADLADKVANALRAAVDWITAPKAA